MSNPKIPYEELKALLLMFGYPVRLQRTYEGSRVWADKRVAREVRDTLHSLGFDSIQTEIGGAAREGIQIFIIPRNAVIWPVE